MRAMRLTVGFREWDKLEAFLEAVNAMAETAGGMIDYNTAFIAAADEMSCGNVEAQLPRWFKDYETERIK